MVLILAETDWGGVGGICVIIFLVTGFLCITSKNAGGGAGGESGSDPRTAAHFAYYGKRMFVAMGIVILIGLLNS
jgi:hypothetical protein